jgi:hypothetical protein
VKTQRIWLVKCVGIWLQNIFTSHQEAKDYLNDHNCSCNWKIIAFDRVAETEQDRLLGKLNVLTDVAHKEIKQYVDRVAKPDKPEGTAK